VTIAFTLRLRARRVGGAVCVYRGHHAMALRGTTNHCAGVKQHLAVLTAVLHDIFAERLVATIEHRAGRGGWWRIGFRATSQHHAHYRAHTAKQYLFLS